MNTPMLPTPPDCGSPCAMCESYAHLLAKAREEIARLRDSHAAIYLALGTNEADHTKWPQHIIALRKDKERLDWLCTESGETWALRFLVDTADPLDRAAIDAAKGGAK